ncbi:tetratricopeptide repeat protein [Parahaliea maris]|uniref:Ancillary SecYEG translocon subunit n=1 Tax=Parahaliea maris TaxID=2716870 RepID=A0A5C9A564_9GAMM|nr:tetratricopeptide repeat protein [Parahaliea maris]TXS95219.1 tetratricopeptide repeat protein [Parahaliea maris]
MEEYRSEEEQVEALKKWWDENGRSTLTGIALALVAAFGWQGWQEYREGQREAASDLYQQLLEAVAGAEQAPAQQGVAERLAAQLKTDFSGTTYAQFASLQVARMAVADDDLDAAEQELRWVLAQADSGSDTALVTQQRLARVVAAKGDTEGALALLDSSGVNPYQATYALARGDILLAAGRSEEALTAYQLARQTAADDAGQVSLAALEQKIASLQPAEPRAIEAAPLALDAVGDAAQPDEAEAASVDGEEEQ